MVTLGDANSTIGKRVLFVLELEELLQAVYGQPGPEEEFSADMCADKEAGVKIVRAVVAQALGILKKWRPGRHLLTRTQIDSLKRWFGLGILP
jgi:hypothetical protein